MYSPAWMQPGLSIRMREALMLMELKEMGWTTAEGRLVSRLSRWRKTVWITPHTKPQTLARLVVRARQLSGFGWIRLLWPPSRRSMAVQLRSYELAIQVCTEPESDFAVH